MNHAAPIVSSPALTLSGGAVLIGGIPIHPIPLGMLVDHVTRRASARAPFELISTVNLDFLRLARHDAAFRTVLQQRTTFNVADGWPVQWLAQLRGADAHRTTGSDLVPALLQEPVAATNGIYLLGDTAATVAAVRARGAADGWAAAIAGAQSPQPEELVNELASERIVAEINASGAGVLLVALGAPRQELWLDRWRWRLKPSIGIGIGAALRFLAHPSRRAPAWMQHVGLEWLHRLGREPRRLGKRYAADFVELARLLADRQ